MHTSDIQPQPSTLKIPSDVDLFRAQREHSGWGGERGNEVRGRAYPGAIVTIVFELPPLCRIWRASWREKQPPPRAVELCSSGVRELRGSSGKGEQLRGEKAVVADREGELPRAGSGLHATTPPGVVAASAASPPGAIA
uniref:Uncharacterized protein n=1 Tax=Oryza glumipatula TaxID=40148 RepID=A0A0D9ZXS7_9ORYZ